MEIYNKFVDLSRIDYDDYKNHYDDLKHLTSKQLKNHYKQFGKYESRIIKFKNFDYDLLKITINKYLKMQISNKKIFTLITTMYNEINVNRLYEYELCIKHNIENNYIEKIIIYYDNSKGTNEEFITKILNNSKIKIINCTKRPTFYEMFLCDVNIKNVIIANFDIIFNNTLDNFNSTNNAIYALTRWDFIDESTTNPRLQHGKVMSSSKDAWIFQSPINLEDFENNDELKSIQIGTWNCDGALNYFFGKSKKIKLIDECLNIQSFHIHFCNARTVKDSEIKY